jgi:LytS/YehU family sensor histidine kinase
MYPLGTLLLTIFIYFVFTATAFYITSYYLIPKFLNTRRYALFFLLLSASLITLALGLAVSLYFHFTSLDHKEDYSQNTVGYLWGSIISILTMTGLLSGAKLLADKIKADRKARLEEQQQLKTELQYLKAQVNPHFLFNAINSVYILIKKDPKQAEETLIKLSDLLRFQLYDCSGDRILIEKEIEYLQNFISLEQLRRGERVKVRFKTQGKFDGYLVAPFLLIPFLENAFKYVSNYPDKPNTVEAKLEYANGRLSASFVNSVDGTPDRAVGGIGLKNVKRRLELIYPGKYELTIGHNPESYSVNLSIQLE